MSGQKKERQEGNGASSIGKRRFHTPQTKGWRVQTAQGQPLGAQASSPMFPLTQDKTHDSANKTLYCEGWRCGRGRL